MTHYAEILEQPERTRALLASHRGVVKEIVASIRGRDIRYVFLAAPGTSDDAGRYANYLLGAMNGLPLALAPKGKVFDSMREMLTRLRREISAELVVISNDERALSLALLPLTIAAQVPEWLSPLIAILAAQLFAFHLTVAKGFNTEQPRTIRKVTETK